jgi:phage gp36-like protein
MPEYATIKDVQIEVDFGLWAEMKKNFTRHHDEDSEHPTFEEAVEAEIRNAQSYIDSFFLKILPVPLAKTTTFVTTCAAKVAAYYLCSNFGNKDPIYIDKYETCTQMLQNVLDSGIAPGMDAEEVANAHFRAGSSKTMFPRPVLAKMYGGPLIDGLPPYDGLVYLRKKASS